MKVVNNLGAVSAPSPVTHYAPQDFSAAYTTVSGIAITGAPFLVDNSSCRVIYVKYRPADGNEWFKPLVNGMDGITIDATNDVINVGGIDSPFASGDTYEVGIQYQDKGYASPTDSFKSTVLNPLNEQYGYETVADVTNLDADTSYYVSLDSYGKSTIQFFQTGGNDTINLKVYGSVQDDGTAAASITTYVDITENGLDWLHTDTPAAVITTSGIVCTKESSGFKYLMLDARPVGGNDDGDFVIYHKKSNT